MNQRVGEVSVNCEFEGVVKHARKNSFQNGTAFIETWIGIHFDEPHRQIVVHHEVVTQNFERACSFVGVELSLDRVDCFGHHKLYVIHQVFSNTNCWQTIFQPLWVCKFIDVLLKLVKVKLISVFKLPIIFAIFLHSIVCQMHIVVLAIIKDVFKPRSPNVAISAEINFEILVDENPNSDVKFSVVD